MLENRFLRPGFLEAQEPSRIGIRWVMSICLDRYLFSAEVGIKALREVYRRTHPAAKAQDNPPESC